MIYKYGKEMDFRALNRDLSFIRMTSVQNSEISLEAYNTGIREIKECPICGCLEKTPLKEINEFLWNRCENCGHLFVSNIPKDMNAIYSNGNAVQKETYASKELFKKRRELIARPKVEFIQDIVVKSPPPGLWIDIGCGVGELLAEASALGWDALGYDADPVEVAFAQEQGINVIGSYFNSAEDDVGSLPNASVVSAMSVIMYISDPLQWLSGIVSHMTRGSYLVIETARAPSVTTVCNLIGLPYKHMMSSGFLHIFTEKSMSILQEHCSIELVAKWAFGNGMIDLLQTALYLGNSDFDSSMLEPLFQNGNALNKAIDEAGLSEQMILIYKVM